MRERGQNDGKAEGAPDGDRSQPTQRGAGLRLLPGRRAQLRGRPAARPSRSPAMTPDLADTMRAGPGVPAPGGALRWPTQGIDQFLDIGSGIPTVGNVHEVAQAADPEARVVYVDIDPVAVAHSRAILAGDDRRRGARRPTCATRTGSWPRPRTAGLLDFDPAGRGAARRRRCTSCPTPTARPSIVATLRDALAPGSYLVISPRDVRGPAAARCSRRRSCPARTAHRDHAALARRDRRATSAASTLVEPGAGAHAAWRPESPDDVDEHPERFGAFGGGRPQGR